MKNKKTTITGLIIASLMTTQPFIENGEFDFKKDWMKYSIAIGIAILSYFAKDHTNENK